MSTRALGQCVGDIDQFPFRKFPPLLSNPELKILNLGEMSLMLELAF